MFFSGSLPPFASRWFPVRHIPSRKSLGPFARYLIEGEPLANDSLNGEIEAFAVIKPPVVER